MHKLKLCRNSSYESALFKNLTRSLFNYGKITTTCFKAKQLASMVSKYVLLIRSCNINPVLSKKRKLYSFFGKNLSKKIFEKLSSTSSSSSNNFVRIAKLGPRKGDSADMAVVELLI